MEWNDRKKKRLAVAGGVALCAALMALVGLRFMAAPEEGRESRGAESARAEASTAEPGGAGLKVEKLEPGMPGAGPEDGKGAGEENTPAGKAANVLVPQTDKLTQKLQADVPGPEAVPESALRDPGRRPDGETVEGRRPPWGMRGPGRLKSRRRRKGNPRRGAHPEDGSMSRVLDG